MNFYVGVYSPTKMCCMTHQSQSNIRFKGLGAGKRQAWTPIRSHGCGLGTPVGCEGLANGTLDRPEEAMDLALGSLLPALEAGLGTPVGCEGLANGTRDRPEVLKKRWIGPWGRFCLRWTPTRSHRWVVLEGGFGAFGAHRPFCRVLTIARV